MEYGIRHFWSMIKNCPVGKLSVDDNKNAQELYNYILYLARAVII
jgi:hypothetical protein